MPVQLSTHTAAPQAQFDLDATSKSNNDDMKKDLVVESNVSKLPSTVSLSVISDTDSTPSAFGSSASSTSSNSNDSTFSSSKLDEIVHKISESEHRQLEEKGLLEPEPLLVENKRRFVLFPIEHNDVSKISVSF